MSIVTERPNREELSDWQRDFLGQLEEALGDVGQLTVQEDRILVWIAGWDSWTVDAVASMFRKARAGGAA